MYLRKTIDKKIVLFMVFLFNAITGINAQQITLSNNLLYDAWLTPNLRIGARLSPHWSMGLTGGYRPWPTSDETSRKWRHVLISPDLRYWTDSVNVHHFFGANLIYSHYNVADLKFPFGMYKSVRNERRQGDLGALGLFYGYSWPLGRHWNIEALIGAAVGYTSYNNYACGHCGKKIGSNKKFFAMPQAALNIVFNFPGRRVLEEPVIETEPVEEWTFIPYLSAVPELTSREGRMHQDERPLNVHFPFDKYELRTDFRDNAQVLSKIIDITRHILTDSTINVKTINIIGLASIEGPIAHNEDLGKNRALALQHYVQQELNLPDSLFGTAGGGEAWDDFRAQLEEEVAKDSAHSEQMRQALAIIDNEQDLNKRERKLKRMNGGSTWRYIAQHILRDQRVSGYMRVYYKYDPDKVFAIVNRAVGLLRTDCSDCHHQALEQLQAVKHDERALNALGVAYYLCGYTSEALDCFKRAADNGDTDAKNNLRQLENR